MKECFNPAFEFHISREARKKYRLEQTLFSTDGHIIFANFSAVRQFVHCINQQRKPEQQLYPGEVNAAGLLDEVFHIVLRAYEKQKNPGMFEKALQSLGKKIGRQSTEERLIDFTEKFPPSAVFNGDLTVNEYLFSKTELRSNASIALEEALMLFLANFNPANYKLRELFDEGQLARPEEFRKMLDALDDFFKSQPTYGPDNQDLISFLKAPIMNSPGSIYGQLEYIFEHWKGILPENLIISTLRAKDLMKEDYLLGHGPAEAPALVPIYHDAEQGNYFMGKSGYRLGHDAAKNYAEPEQFTPDTQWMPRVVLLAKNIYVWLDQLSKQYQREIRRLDQIPDETLEQLENWNFNGLWLIGIWERSFASKRIKHIMGNIEAVSSAYSLYDYEIAADLGGEQAYQTLNERARARGIRLASDMVPNHTGLFSKWIIEHPDYFIQNRISPFPGYRFNGENLSQHPDIELRIEDGYYSQTDAAVVFQRIDKTNHDVRYIYHGNDGTNMPWNDTAQLDMLKHEVREAVIQKIFEVARRFSIIRFDAAMTLAKKHFSRLWYPSPGSGGDIPSRTDNAMSSEEFDALFPVEFWREVVDRINRDLPETLLLAEAFWLMEGYFVRTLGMHRVYNSAFMHMLKNEENEKYRDLITNTLEFEPEILKRYVNFMSNPDEETAIRQFGSDDKYFGVCVLMSTLPGLPMFAHGQIEGYTEKYGMEYQRAYYNEWPNQWLVERHQREIFPLTQKRYVFSEIDHFNFFDYTDQLNQVNENVFAFTNRSGDERVLVLFNNKYESALGGIKTSVPKLTRFSIKKELVSLNLAQALNLNTAENIFYTFKEQISGLEFLRKGVDLHHQGFCWNLKGFEYRIFIDFREIYDTNGEIAAIHDDLQGAGVRDIDNLLAERHLKPALDAFKNLLADDVIQFIFERMIEDPQSKQGRLNFDCIVERFKYFSETLPVDEFKPETKIKATEIFTFRLKSLRHTFDFLNQNSAPFKELLAKVNAGSLPELMLLGSKKNYRENLMLLISEFVIDSFTSPHDLQDADASKKLLLRLLQKVLRKSGRGDTDIALDIILLGLLCEEQHYLFDFRQPAEDLFGIENPSKAGKLKARKIAGLITLLGDVGCQKYLGVNQYEQVWYYSKEQFESLIDWLFMVTVLEYFREEDSETQGYESDALWQIIMQTLDFSIKVKETSRNSGYQFDKLKKNLLDIPGIQGGIF